MDLIFIIITLLVIVLLVFWNRRLSSQITTNSTRLENEINQCQRTGDALFKSEQRYRQLVDSAMVGVFSSNFEGQFTYVNEALARMFDFDSAQQMTANGSLNRWKNLSQREQFLSELKAQGSVSNFQVEAITLTGRNIYVIFSAALFADTISGMVMDITQLKQAEQSNLEYQQKLKSLAFQLTLAEEQERHRIAIEIHDHFGQSLVFYRVQLAQLRKQVAEQKALELIDELSQSFLHMIHDTKDLVFELSSPLLHEVGLSSAISQWLTEQIGDKYNLETDFNNHSQIELQDQELKNLLFRNVRELLFNTVKHAHATKIFVTIESNDNNLEIIIQDDGVGFVVKDAPKMNSPGSQFGLFSIYERMDNVGGSLIIESAPGNGCKAILSVPIQDHTAEKE